MSTAVQTQLPINNTVEVTDVPFSAPYNLVDAEGVVVQEVKAQPSQGASQGAQTKSVQTEVSEPGCLGQGASQGAKAEPARKSFTRSHTAEADRQARALCRSIAKAGKVDEANYLLHHWFPRKSDALIARAYEAAKTKGAHIVLDMLAYEDRNRKKFGSWDNIPRSIRSLLT
jgi:hypothetical protein